MISKIEKKPVNLQGLPTCPQNLVNIGQQTAEKSWRVFAHPIIFARRTSCGLAFATHFGFNHIRQIASIVDADAKSLVSVGEAAHRAGSHWALLRI